MVNFHLEARGKDEKVNERKKQSRPPVTRPPDHDHTTPDTNMESRDPTTRTGRPITDLVALTANTLGRGEMRHRDWLVRPGHLSACFHHGRRWHRIGAAWTATGWGLNGFAIVWCSRKEGRWDEIGAQLVLVLRHWLDWLSSTALAPVGSCHWPISHQSSLDRLLAAQDPCLAGTTS